MEPSRKTKIAYGWILPTILPLLGLGIVFAAFLVGGFWMFVAVGIVLIGGIMAWTRRLERKIRENEPVDPQL